jgi:hypothetical protein
MKMLLSIVVTIALMAVAVTWLPGVEFSPHDYRGMSSQGEFWVSLVGSAVIHTIFNVIIALGTVMAITSVFIILAEDAQGVLVLVIVSAIASGFFANIVLYNTLPLLVSFYPKLGWVNSVLISLASSVLSILFGFSASINVEEKGA